MIEDSYQSGKTCQKRMFTRVCSGREDQRKTTRPYEITEETEEGYVKAIFVDIQSTFDSLWLLGLMVELKQTVLVTCT